MGFALLTGGRLFLTGFVNQVQNAFCKILVSSKDVENIWCKQWDTPRKAKWGYADPFPKPFSHLWSKSAIFATLFMTWLKIWYPIYECCSWFSYPKHKFNMKGFWWRSFWQLWKSSFSKKHIQYFQSRVLKP